MSCHLISMMIFRVSLARPVCLGHNPGVTGKDDFMILRFLLGLTVLAIWLAPAPAGDKGVEFRNGVVVSVSAPGSDAGLTILKEGGNAVDAAVATAFALAVTHPAAGNIGGGGFMVVHPPKAMPTVFEYRETAPAAATKTMFKKSDSPYSHRVVGVPGTVRGMALAHQKFGKLPWKQLVMPAALLAEKGYVLDKYHADSLNKLLVSTKKFAEFQRVFA